MTHGITFRGKHSREFNIVVKTVGRPIIAPVKQTDEEIPYRDGNIDCSETGGRLFYNDKVLELEFSFLAVNTTELHILVTNVINWLAGGYGELIFDDMPNVIWVAKPVQLDNLSILLHRDGKANVQFRCHPFNQWIYDSTGIPIDSDYILDSDIPLGFGDENYITIYPPDHDAHTLNYAGSAPVRPLIRVTFSAAGQTIRIGKMLNSHTLVEVPIGFQTETAGTFEFDCATGTMPENCSGNFFELTPGENILDIWGDTEVYNENETIDIEFVYKHNFLYGDGGMFNAIRGNL